MASNIEICVTGGDLSPVAQAEIRQRLEDLDKRFARLKNLDLTLDIKNLKSPRAKLNTLIGEGEDFSFDASADNAVAAVEAAIRGVAAHLKAERDQRQKEKSKTAEKDGSKLPTIGTVAVLVAVAAFVVSWLFQTDRGVELVKVRGRVSFNGGSMPGPGSLFFTPASTTNEIPPRAGSATFNSDGLYAAGSFNEGDGLMPGEYIVVVKCWKVSPNIEDAVPVSHIPEAYTKPTTSGLTVNVPKDSGPLKVDFDLID